MADSEVAVPYRRREGAEAVLAKNLVAARVAAGWTQDALSNASGISRATIAQLETGVSDPRLSTLEALAAAVPLPLASLLLSEVEVRALAGLGDRVADHPVVLTPVDVRQLRRWVHSGMLRDRAEVVRLVAQRLAGTENRHPLAIQLAAMFAPSTPEDGPAVGAAWGERIARESSAAE